MVARGDLGVEIPMVRVPIVQKEVVKKANDAAKVSVIATQILRSMVYSPTPTRAEVSDIFNATLDGCDAIMLSEETAIGDYPVEVVKVADSAIREAETVYPYYKDHPLETAPRPSLWPPAGSCVPCGRSHWSSPARAEPLSKCPAFAPTRI